ncbi:hypothetical protein DSM100688_0039 [Bifidobacterium ramosum]|uniref:DUF2975 domain-containing protein n=1 Tax=Bifidobacterium ramosum TaxID=1798158 RepID=A0A6L4X1S8_9BIFI|nr:hypothetical protein [Bifidobacterium ramosum]KAB8288961.1 hypothetical protein DSM100688_0039 [Bifidobacterium ramosum]NEG70678.1 hypothetical protein [Bifidobacterium ramosum]
MVTQPVSTTQSATRSATRQTKSDMLLDRAGGAAVVIARIAAVILAFLAVIQLVITIMFLVDGRSFAPDATSGYAVSMDAGIGTAIITGHFLDSDIRLVNWTNDAINAPAVVLVSLERTAILTLFALVFGELAALLANLRDWLRDRVRYADAEAGTPSPFRTVPIERLDRVGWYLITAPVSALVVTGVCALLGCAVSVTGGSSTAILVMLGILAFMFARVFGYGAALQHDVDGLL